MAKRYNQNPILLSEGEAWLDGNKILDVASLSIVFTPGTVSTRSLGKGHTSTRWTKGTWSGTLKEYRTTPWLKELIKKYTETGVTPEFKITGKITDTGSDYYTDNGTETVTCKGCVITSDITMINLEADSDDVLTDEIQIAIYSVDM